MKISQLRKLIREQVEQYLDEAQSQASIEAMRRGLHPSAYGRFVDDQGNVVAKSIENGRKLVAISGDKETEMPQTSQQNSFSNFRNLVNRLAYGVKDPKESPKNQEHFYKVLQFLQKNREGILYNNAHPETMEKLTKWAETHPYNPEPAQTEPQEEPSEEPQEPEYTQIEKETEPDLEPEVEVKKETKGETGWGEWNLHQEDPHADGI